MNSPTIHLAISSTIVISSDVGKYELAGETLLTGVSWNGGRNLIILFGGARLGVLNDFGARSTLDGVNEEGTGAYDSGVGGGIVSFEAAERRLTADLICRTVLRGGRAR